jgi:hypothetical protein
MVVLLRCVFALGAWSDFQPRGLLIRCACGLAVVRQCLQRYKSGADGRNSGDGGRQV